MNGPDVAPGQVWWCDGVALSFEPCFKRRPVLVLTVSASAAGPEALLAVAPLSSHRRCGQEQAVTHAGGVSYLTGSICEVPLSALYRPLGVWEGFADWQAAQMRPALSAWEALQSILVRLFRRNR